MPALTPYDALRQSQALFRGDVAAQLRLYGSRLADDLAAERPDVRVLNEEAIFSDAADGPLLRLRFIGEGGREQGLEITLDDRL